MTPDRDNLPAVPARLRGRLVIAVRCAAAWLTCSAVILGDDPAPSIPPAPMFPAEVFAAPLPLKPTARSAPNSERGNLKLQKEQRVEEIKRQIDELSNRWSRIPSPPAEAAVSPTLPEANEPPATTSHSSAPDVVANPDAGGSEPVPAGEHTAPAASPPAAEPAAVPAEAITVDGAIDRFSLATSLFGTGDVDTCLKVLEQLDLTSLPRSSQFWGEYMQAGCHRRSGRIDEAQKIYRRILAEPDADWIGDMSRWWLNNLDEKARLEADVKRLSDSLAAWEKEIDGLKKAKP